MSQRNSFAAIKEIKSWSVDDVLTVLNKNGLESTCAVFQRREIDGEDLLNLTEGKLALWKRDLSLADIRKLSRFMNDLNTSPERFLLIQNGRRQNGAAKPQGGWPAPTSLPPLPPLPPRPRSPASDTGSWDTDFEDDHDPTEDVYSEPPDDGHPQPSLKPNAGFLYSMSAAAAPLPQKPTPVGNLYTRSPTLAAGVVNPVKPPIPIRPTGIAAPKPWSNGGGPHPLQGNTSALFGGMLPQPPTPRLENLISNLNLPPSNCQDEYFEDEYTSIEEGVGCTPQSLGFPPRGPEAPSEQPAALPPRKITPAEQPSMQSMHLPTRKITPAEQPSMTFPPRAITPTEQPSPESTSAASPNPYPKLSFGTSHSRPPAVLPSTPPVRQEEPHFNNIPAGIPNQMSALSNKTHGLKPPMPLPAYNNNNNHHQGSNLSLDQLGGSGEHLAGPDGDTYEPEQYECIDPPPSQGSDYYLQPLSASASASPTLSGKACRGGVAAPEIVTPSSRPPSPPRKKSFPDDVACADGSGGKLSDKLRSLMKMRQASTCSMEETPREKSPMPELQKPPPVERPGPGPRPLPPTPDAARKPGQDKMNPRRNSRVFTQMPWYHNVDRKRAEEMLKNGEDGKFLLRPSMQTQNPLTLTLWYNKRLYNISVRQRTDQRYALGTEKPNEQSFSSVEELVQHYQGEELVLYSGGERTGKTLLTSSPPRQSN